MNEELALPPDEPAGGGGPATFEEIDIIDEDTGVGGESLTVAASVAVGPTGMSKGKPGKKGGNKSGKPK